MNAYASGIIMDAASEDLPAFARRESGINMIAQRVRVRTLTYKGDWPLDTSAGIDWIRHLTTKPADPEALAADLAAEWANTPGILSVTDLSAAMDTSGVVTISARLETVTGEVLQPVVTAPGIDGNPSIALGSIVAAAGWVVG